MAATDPITPEMLRSLMERHGWTQADLAAALNTPPSTVSYWMNGVKSPGRYYAGKIREMLAEPAGAGAATTRKQLRAIVDVLPDDALPLVGAMLEGVARHYGIVA